MNSEKLLMDLARADAEVREAQQVWYKTYHEHTRTPKISFDGVTQDAYNALTTARRRRGARRALCLKAGRKLMEAAQ